MSNAQTDIPKRPLTTTLTLVALWIVFYASFTLVTPALLDDADSVHAEVAREMLLRHDWTTLYANGIRYLEKAPLLYWSMATSMGISQLLGGRSPEALAVAARIPLALTILALALAVEAFARRAFRSARAGLYAALILLSSPGIFLFTRTTIPDAMLCLWLTLAMLAFWQTEQPPPNILILSETKNPCISPEAPQGRVAHPFQPHQKGWIVLPTSTEESSVPLPSQPHRDGRKVQTSRWICYIFAACCALGVLTKGLIGLLFPIAIVGIYLLLTRGLRNAIRRIGQFHLLSSTLVFLAIAAPWHILIALANPTQGLPGGLSFHAGHWQVPLPTDGNVHGWAWFYFVNEQLLRYLNLRVPRDYDTVPLYLFWGLILIWLMPWSSFMFKALQRLKPEFDEMRRLLRMGKVGRLTMRVFGCCLVRHLNPLVLLATWALLPLLFFSLSTRQEYYVLPALPPLAILTGYWLARDSWLGSQPVTKIAKDTRRASLRCRAVILGFGTVFAAAALFFILHTSSPAPDSDLAALLQQNPSDYAMSMGHFLDLNAQALGLFRLPLAIAAASLFLGPLASFLLRRVPHPSSAWVGSHAATLALAAGAFGFLLAAHLGLRIFAPVLSSQQLAAAIAPQVQPNDLIVIHQEYEYGSTLGFYLQRPSYHFFALRISPHQTTAPTDHDSAEVALRPIAVNPIHILTDASYNGTADYGRSSNLWYGSFFPDAPRIFETPATLAQKWHGPQRIFLWQDLAAQPSALPAQLSPIYVVAKSGGKEIVSNQPNRR